MLTAPASVISAISRGQICERVEREKRTIAFALERDRAHGALFGAKPPARLERNDPVVHRAGNGRAMHDSLAERSRLERTTVLNSEE